MEQQPKEPKYKLIQARTLETDCAQHKTQMLVDLFNDPIWSMDPVDLDKMLFKCRVCGSERVYQLLPEKTIL